MPGAPAVPTPSPRDGDRDEAFFNDEAGTTRTPEGLRENRFVHVGQNKSDYYANPLAPGLVDVPEAAPVPRPDEPPEERSYTLYVPPGVESGVGVVHISLLFGVGLEVVRHGLRTFFEHSPNTVLLLVPGIEGESPNWGVGINKSIIDGLFAIAGLGSRAWMITTIACFSTGHRGFNGTINNTLGRVAKGSLIPPKLTTGLALSNVTMVIFYDCLYRGDNPAPGGNTQNALRAMESATGGRARFVMYEATEGGTPRQAGQLRVPIQTIVPADRLSIINLKPRGAKHNALAYARMFDAAIQDNYLTLDAAPLVIRDLLASPLPARGTVASQSPLAPFRETPPGAITLDAWAAKVSSAVSRLQGQAEALRAKYIANPSMKWMGWAPPAVGEITHDSFMSEYGWEFLAG
jgi:hypothetical protein